MGAAEVIDLHQARARRRDIATRNIRFDEFLKLDLPEPKDRIEGLVPDGGYTSWNGPPGVGKTFLSLEAAISIATGQPFLGKFPTIQGRVLLVDQESHPGRLQERVARMVRGRNLPSDTPMYFRLVDGLYVDSLIDDPAGGFQQLRRALDETGACLFVLDSFTRAHQGKENDSGSMADVSARIKALMFEFDCGCMVIDHATKPQAGMNRALAGDRLRGSSEKLAALDASLFFEKSLGEENVIVCTPSKSRWSKEIEPFTVEIRNGSDGAIRLAFAGTRSNAEDAKPNMLLAEIENIEEQTGRIGVTQLELRAALGLGESTVRRYRIALEKAQLIVPMKRASTGGKPATAYTINREGSPEPTPIRRPQSPSQSTFQEDHRDQAKESFHFSPDEQKSMAKRKKSSKADD